MTTIPNLTLELREVRYGYGECIVKKGGLFQFHLITYIVFIVLLGAALPIFMKIVPELWMVFFDPEGYIELTHGVGEPEIDRIIGCMFFCVPAFVVLGATVVCEVCCRRRSAPTPRVESRPDCMESPNGEVSETNDDCGG